MDEVKQIIVNAVNAANGAIGWDALLSQVPENQRRHFVRALKSLERDGTHLRKVTATPDGATFQVVRL